jgi:hypothetical protein
MKSLSIDQLKALKAKKDAAKEQRKGISPLLTDVVILIFLMAGEWAFRVYRDASGAYQWTGKVHYYGSNWVRCIGAGCPVCRFVETIESWALRVLQSRTGKKKKKVWNHGMRIIKTDPSHPK